MIRVSPVSTSLPTRSV